MEKSSTAIFVAVVAILIICVLAGLLYYYSVASVPVPPQMNSGQQSVKPVVKEKQPEETTDIISFKVPDELPKTVKWGSCFASSVSAPYRQDAFRCSDGNQIFDPCFATPDKKSVYCKEDPLKQDSFVIKLTKVLPKTQVPMVLENWAWFLQLKDGTICSPFTGTRPFYGQNQVGYYGCTSNDKTQQIVILGELESGSPWKANKAIMIKVGAKWTIKSAEKVNVATVWQ